MDYLPVFEGEAEDGSAVTVSPGKLQRTGAVSYTHLDVYKRQGQAAGAPIR